MKKEKSNFKKIILLLILMVPLAATPFIIFGLSQKISKDISSIQNELQSILDQRLNKFWTKEELQEELNKKYGNNAINVELIFFNYAQKSFEQKTEKYKFTGNNLNNDETIYTGSIELAHNFKLNKTKNIFEVKTQLQDLLNSPDYTNKSWTKTALEQAIFAANID
ncbi:hypothetical protein, partial [Williamsoniiplasma somnilux]